MPPFSSQFCSDESYQHWEQASVVHETCMGQADEAVRRSCLHPRGRCGARVGGMK